MQSIVQKRKKNTVSGKRKEETILGHDIWRKIKPLLPPPPRTTLEGCVECTPLQNKISLLFCLCCYCFKFFYDLQSIQTTSPSIEDFKWVRENNNTKIANW